MLSVSHSKQQQQSRGKMKTFQLAKSICNQKDINEKSKILRTFSVCVCVFRLIQFHINISSKVYVLLFIVLINGDIFSLNRTKTHPKSSWTSHTSPFIPLKEQEESFNLDLAIKRILSVNYAVYQRYNKLKQKLAKKKE